MCIINSIDEKRLRSNLESDIEFSKKCIEFVEYHFVKVENSQLKEFGEKVIKIYKDIEASSTTKKYKPIKLDQSRNQTSPTNLQPLSS